MNREEKRIVVQALNLLIETLNEDVERLKKRYGVLDDKWTERKAYRNEVKAVLDKVEKSQ